MVIVAFAFMQIIRCSVFLEIQLGQAVWRT